MKTPTYLILAFLGVCQLAAKPNVVLIMADDFGVGAVNAYGASTDLVRTPGLNRLADEGMLFTNANTPGSICSPTRYALLTGQYAWRGPLPFGVVNTDDPMVVEAERVTMPKYFQKLGYTTAQIGKWHLGYGNVKPVDYTSQLTPGPNDIGFDYHFGLPQNLDDKMRVWIENDGIYGLRSKKVSQYSKSFYGGKYMGFDAPQRVREEASEYLTDKAIDWIKMTHRSNPEAPFFLYFAPPATHHPIVPSEDMRGASGCGAYGDFIQDLDLSVSRIVDALEYEGIAENTIIIFTADNGADIPTNDNMRPENQAIKAGLKPNGVNRGDKHTIYEGGARVPLLVRWDGKVAAGQISDRMVNIVDIYSTLVEAVSGGTPSSEEAPDSVSFAPTIMGETQEARPAMITSNVAGLHAIREGKWKFIDGKYPDNTPKNFINTTKDQAEPALFNLEEDPSETKNLLAEHPEVVERMQEMLDGLRAAPTRQ
ncbi:MAG: sulfatase family protein [Opitutales bacterium]